MPSNPQTVRSMSEAVGWRKVPALEEAMKPTMTFVALSTVYMEHQGPRERLYKIFFFVIGLLSTVHVSYSAYVCLGDFDSVAVLLFHVIMYILTPFWMPLLIIYRPSAGITLNDSCMSYNYNCDTMRKIQDEFIVEGKNKYRVSYCRRVVSLFLLSMVNAGVMGIMERVSGEKHMQIYKAWYPSFIDLDNIFVNICTHSLQVFVSHSAIMIYANLLSILLIYNQLTTELSLLRRSLELLEPRAVELARDTGTDLASAYRICLRMSLQHHQHILRYFHDVEPFVRLITNTMFFVLTCLLICTGFAFTAGTSVTRNRFITVSMIELIYIYSICWGLGEIAVEAEEVKVAVYGVDWVKLPKDCRSNLKIFLTVCSRKLAFTLSTGVEVNREAFMELLKGSYSYFNMLLVATGGEDL